MKTIKKITALILTMLILVTSIPLVNIGGINLGVTAHAKDEIIYELLGDAKVLPDDSIELTKLATWQSGGVWFKEKLYAKDGITVKFSYWAGGGRGDSYGGADGIVLAFANNTYNLGEQGEYLGFVQDDALGVEFDSYYQNPNDPRYKHLAIIRNNVRTHLANIKEDRVDDSVWHNVVVSISGENVTVVLDGKEVLSYDKVDFLHDELYVGFAAATGSGKNRHLIRDVVVENSDKEIPMNISFEKYYQGQNPKEPSISITPQALDGGWGAKNKVSKGTYIYNEDTKDYKDHFEIERSKAVDKNGKQSGKIIVKSDGFRNHIMPAEVVESIKASTLFYNLYAKNVYMQLDCGDGKPYISSVYARNNNTTEYTDIRANKILCNKKNTQDIIVSVDGLSDGESVSNVFILQSAKESFDSTNGIFNKVQLASKLEQEKAVYVYAVTNKGRQTELQEVKIDVGANDQFADGLNNMFTMDLLGVNGQSIGLDTDIPFLKDAKISLDALKIPVGVSKDGDTWRISFGVDIFTHEKEIEGGEVTKNKWRSFKEQVDEQCQWFKNPIFNNDDKDSKSNKEDQAKKQKSFKDAINDFNDVKKTFGDKKKVEEYINSKKKKEIDFNVGALGYIEGTLCDGVWTTTAWNGGILINFEVEKSAPIAVLGFPCYWGIGGGVAGRANYTGSRQVASKDVPMETTWFFEIKPKVTGKFGAGVDKLLYAGVTGEGFVPVNFVTADKYLKIEFGATLGWEAGIWILTADGVIWDHDPVTIVEKYFNTPSRVVRSFAMDRNVNSALNNAEPETNILSRDYAETTSEWLFGEPEISTFALRDYVQQGVTFTDLQQSVFADSKLQMVQIGDDTFATWIEDDTLRDTYNRMRLVYSVRDGDTGLWSEPKAVWDTGVNDGYPSVATDGEKVYITWQKIDKVITEADCSDATVFYNNGEICLAEYDINTDKIVSSEIITDNNYYDYSPIVIVNNSKPIVFWTSSEDNNMTAMDGCDFNRYSNGTTTTLLDGISSPITVSAEVIDGKEYISYCTDTDGDFSTTEDITVNTYVDGTVTTFDKGDNSLAIKDAKYGKLDGESVLFMQDGTNIFYEQEDETVYVFDVDRNIDGSFIIVEAINGAQLIWTEKDVNGLSNIYSCVYSDGEWSDPVKVSENDKYITNLTAVCANGKIIGGCNRTEVTYNEETQEVTKGLTDLSYWSMEDFSDISIELFSYREKDFIESGSKSFDLHISNNGTTNIDEIEFVIEDTLGNSTTVIKEVNLISGDAQTVEVPYIPAENYSATTLTVTAIIPDDIDEEDNVASFEVGSSDVAIEVGDVIEMEDCFDISTLISNISLIDAKNVKLSIYANSEDSEAVETFNIGNMTASSISDAHISIKKEAVTFSESGMGLVYLKLTANDESNTDNNDVCVPLITEKEKECGHPLTESVAGSVPTCTEDGASDYEICLVCGENATESKVIPAKHSLGEWFVSTPATCIYSGTNQRNCSVCDYYETQDVSATGHKFNGSKCSNCGYDKAIGCSCRCHKTGIIARIIWRFTVVLNKLLRRNQICSCGASHY